MRDGQWTIGEYHRLEKHPESRTEADGELDPASPRIMDSGEGFAGVLGILRPTASMGRSASDRSR